MALRHLPVRTCVACRTERPKREMVRIVRANQGAVTVDETGKLSGRGAYLCRQANCWATGLSKQSLARALKTDLSVSDRAALEQYAARFHEAPIRGVESSVEGGLK